MRRCSSMTPLNLLCLSSRGGLAFLGCCGAVEVAVDLAGEVALEASTDLAEGAAFSGSALNVGAGGRVHAHAGDDGHVERAVEPRSTDDCGVLSGSWQTNVLLTWDDGVS